MKIHPSTVVIARAGTSRPSVPGTPQPDPDRSTAAATVHPISSASTSSSPVLRKSNAASTRPARRTRRVRRPSSYFARKSPAAQAAPTPATNRRKIVPGLTCGNPFLRGELELARPTDDPPVDRLPPAAGRRQRWLAAAKSPRIEVDDQAALAANAQVEQRLEPLFIRGGRDHDQAAAMPPLLPLRVEQGGERDGTVGLRQREMLEELLLLLFAAGGLDHAEPAVVADQADGAATPQRGIRDRGRHAHGVLEGGFRRLAGVDGGLQVEHDPGIAALAGFEAAAHEPTQARRRGPVNALDAVGRHVLPNGGGVRGDVEHPPAQLFVAGGTGGQRIERSNRSYHRVDDHRLAAGHAERAGEEAEGIAVAQLHRTKREEAALLELTARRPPPRTPALQAEHPPGVIPRKVGKICQLDQRDRDPGAILDRELLFEVVAHLELALWTGPHDREVLAREPAPEIAHDEDQDQRIEQAVSQPDSGDVG